MKGMFCLSKSSIGAFFCFFIERRRLASRRRLSCGYNQGAFHRRKYNLTCFLCMRRGRAHSEPEPIGRCQKEYNENANNLVIIIVLRNKRFTNTGSVVGKRIFYKH